MKKIMFGAMALISLSVAASAALTSSIPGITVTESSCDDGYVITSTREGVAKTVEYDSCASDGIVVLDAEGNVVDGGSEEGEYKTIDGVEYYFPAGYTEPTVALGGTCATGLTNGSGSCDGKSLTELEDGYLNILKISGDFSLEDNKLTNVDGLSNLTSVGTTLLLNNNQLTNVDGLSNLTSVGQHLKLNNNKLTNVDGLSNLTSVGYSLYLYSNPNLTDLSGLNNLTYVGSFVWLDRGREYEVKLDADSYLCVNFDSKFKDDSGNPLIKSNVCND